jgi:hypothetical protein
MLSMKYSFPTNKNNLKWQFRRLFLRWSSKCLFEVLILTSFKAHFLKKNNFYITYTKYTVFNVTWNFLFILILPRHVSASLGHHQVLLLKLSHCNFYIICSFRCAYLFICLMPHLICSLSAQVQFLVFTIFKFLKNLWFHNIHSQGTITRWGKLHHKDFETHKWGPGSIKDILHNRKSGGHRRGKIGKVLVRVEVLEML